MKADSRNEEYSKGIVRFTVILNDHLLKAYGLNSENTASFTNVNTSKLEYNNRTKIIVIVAIACFFIIIVMYLDDDVPIGSSGWSSSGGSRGGSSGGGFSGGGFGRGGASGGW